MKYFTNIKVLTFLFFLFYFMYPQEAYAYLDPGTGSYFFQILIGILLGTLFAVRLYWGKIKIFLKNLFVKGDIHGRGDE